MHKNCEVLQCREHITALIWFSYKHYKDLVASSRRPLIQPAAKV